MSEFSIYLGDKSGNVTHKSIEEFNIKNIYIFNTKSIVDYSVYTGYLNFGDVLIGTDFMICIIYQNLNLLDPSKYNWSLYILLILDLLQIETLRKIKIYTNNNNSLIKYNSLENTKNALCDIIGNISEFYKDIEIC